jgi:hypothetical protein
VQKVRTTHFNPFFTNFFTRSSAHGMDSSRLATTAPTKVTVEKTPNRAGATPLFGGQSAQKFVGSLPPAPSGSGPCFVRVHDSEQTVCSASRITSRKRKGGKQLPLLKAPSKQPKTTTLQVRLEEEVRHNLDRYAEFIGANVSYVVSEALKLLFKRDDEFKRWLGEHPTNINQQQIKKGLLTKTA